MTCNYLLFSHLNEQYLQDLLQNRNDWLRDLVTLLDNVEFPGKAVLFCDLGWNELVQCIVRHEDVSEAMVLAKAAAALAASVEAAAQPFLTQAASPVLVVTTLDLLPLIFNLSGAGIARTKLANFLGRINSYDGPKLIESFVRQRNLGGCPVLRVDRDVLFTTLAPPRANAPPANAPRALADPISVMVNEYSRLSASPDLQAFIISGAYINSAAATPPAAWGAAWLQAFATRPFPALALDPSGQLVFDAATLLAFYGLTPAASAIAKSAAGAPSGISFIGAPPLTSPVSGAMQTFNAPLVVDAPPFCNFRTNVMWIDDFLKYAMHREMHRTSGNAVAPVFLAAPLIAATAVFKERGPVSNARNYTLHAYIPTVARGCVFDAWIQPDPATKLNFAAAAAPGPFVRYLQKARRQGHLNQRQIQSCRAELQQSAIGRLEDVRVQWAALPLVTGPTLTTALPSLATEWVTGQTAAGLGNLIELETLIEDALEYIEWAVAWPAVVYAVRALPRGSLKFDLP